MTMHIDAVYCVEYFVDRECDDIPDGEKYTVEIEDEVATVRWHGEDDAPERVRVGKVAKGAAKFAGGFAIAAAIMLLLPSAAIDWIIVVAAIINVMSWVGERRRMKHTRRTT